MPVIAGHKTHFHQIFQHSMSLSSSVKSPGVTGGRTDERSNG